jgi:lauroyl/myristoyl acyltransferase
VGRRGDVRVLEEGEPFGVTGTIEEATARCNAVLEEWIRRAPEEWTWFHDRFGSAPSRSSS